MQYNRQIYYDWTFDINPDWRLTNRGLYLSQSYFSAFSQGVFATGPEVLVQNLWGKGSDFTFAGNVDLTGKFSTGPIKHSVLVGTDTNVYTSPNAPETGGAYTNFINIYNPIYYPSGYSLYDPNNYYFGNHEGYLWKGIYGQDMMSAFDDSVHLLLGGRWDWADVSNAQYPYPSTALTTIQDRAFSPRVGFLIQPLPWLSFYGSYSRSFGENNGVNPADRTIFPPQKGLQWEGGAKAEFFDKRLSVTMSFFDLYKSNIPTLGPANTTILIGLAQSQGVELDMTGKINDNWSLIANYTHEDVRVVSGSPYDPLTEIQNELPVAGNWLTSVPANAGNIWIKYDADGDFRGLSLMGGVNVIGSRWGDLANSFKIDAYTLVNGGFSYRIPWEGAKITAQVNVSNLLNTSYYIAASTRINIWSGTPRSVLGSLRLEY